MATPTSRVLSSSQLATLAEHGEERSAEVGEKLFEIGDETYPFIAIVEGEVAVLDGAGREIVRHGASGFLGEMNLLSGQTVFLTAVVTEPMRYIAVDREVLRRLLFEDGSLSDLLLSAFIERRELLQQRDGIGLEIVGPRDSAETRRLLDFARRLRLPHSWLAPEESDEAAALIERTDPDELPIVRLPGGAELRRPTNGELSRALGIGLELEQREEVDLLVVGGGPAGLGAAVYGASEGLDTLVIESTVLGGQAGTSRRIENYLGFPAGISGTELTSRAVTQARKFGARTATPYRARSTRARRRPPPGHARGRQRDRRPRGAARDRRRIPAAAGRGPRQLRGDQRLLRGRPARGAALRRPAGRRDRRRQLGRRRRPSGWREAARWSPSCTAAPTSPRRCPSYLIEELERYGVAVRDRSEVSALHGEDGLLEAVTLTDGTRLPLSFLFLFLGASPCTDWLGDVVARDPDGFVLTGPEAGAEGLLETSVPGIYAAGDVRAGSIKRCATAVGEGATVVRFVHEHISTAGASVG